MMVGNRLKMVRLPPIQTDSKSLSPSATHGTHM
jgi:hypothetical protein